MNFKSQLEHDIKRVFHSSSEFAEVVEIRYNGNFYKIPVVLDYEGAKERKIPSGDHAGGIFVSDLTVYIAHSDIRVIPRKGRKFEIKDDVFKIIKVSYEAGEIILDLEMIDE